MTINSSDHPSAWPSNNSKCMSSHPGSLPRHNLDPIWRWSASWSSPRGLPLLTIPGQYNPYLQWVPGLSPLCSIELYSPVHSCTPQNLAEAVDSQSWICNPCSIVNNEIRRGNIITPPSLSSIKTGLLHKALKSVVIGRNVVILNSLPVRNLKFRSIGFDLRR